MKYGVYDALVPKNDSKVKMPPVADPRESEESTWQQIAEDLKHNQRSILDQMLDKLDKLEAYAKKQEEKITQLENILTGIALSTKGE